MDGETLTDFDKPADILWPEYTVLVLENALLTRRMVLFDLTYVLDIDNVLKGGGRYAASITGHELRYLHTHWTRFQPVVRFYEMMN